MFSKNGVPNYCDVYTIFPTSYRALYYSEWVKSVNFVNLNLTGGWNTSIAVGGFECGDQAGFASASIVAVTLPNGSYWGILYPVEPFRTWQQVVSNIPVVDGEWIHFVLYFDAGTGNNGNVTLWVENIQGDMVNVVSVFGFNSSLDYQSTGAWAGQYIANVKNTGFTTEFYEDTVIVATVFPISKP